MNIRFWLLIIGILFLGACEDEASVDALTCTGDYDQTALLENMVNNIILPSYQKFSSDLSNLQSSIDNLLDEPTAENLASTKNDFITAYSIFQHSSNFEFGPAAEVSFRSNLNNFPANIDVISTNLNTGTFEFDTPDADLNFDKGFPALDYFLYGFRENEVNLLEEISSNENLRNYLQAVIQDMLDRTNSVNLGWETYKDSFLSAKGTDAGSSLSQIINSFNENYEHAKRAKLGEPGGVNALGIVYPEGVEALYSGLSLDLLKLSLFATQDIYFGSGFSTAQDGESLDDLLNYVDAQKEGIALHKIITDQYILIRQKLDEMEGTLAESIETDLAKVQAAYAEYSKQVIHTKTDLPSILCIAITYVDNPSDSD